MSQLKIKSLDKDLMILDELVDDLSIPERNWETIINLYNQNNSDFPIPPTICAKIILEIKDGRIPKMVFKQRGISYNNFNNRYNKSKLIIEELSSKSELSDNDWQHIYSLRNDPAFILGQDIERARAFNFNQATDELKSQANMKFETWLEYMKQIHKEEFEQKEEKKGAEVTIIFQPGLLESI